MFKPQEERDACISRENGQLDELADRIAELIFVAAVFMLLL